MSIYLSHWYDPGIQPGKEKPDAISQQEHARLSRLYAVANAAARVPRRRGGDASSAELALDKKRCKRIAHVAQQLATAWGGAVDGAGPDVGRVAASINWEQWWGEHQTWLENRRRYIATWAQTEGADEKWAKSAVVKLSNELEWLSYAMR